MIQVNNLSKVYKTRSGHATALDDVSLSVEEGTFVTIKGPSGCGKTTLLLAIGGMLRPDGGEIELSGQSVYGITKAERAKLRSTSIGFVFQLFHLVPYLNIMENVKLGNAGIDNPDALLEKFGLGDRKYHRPDQLSAGEKQRVAIARAVIKSPKLLLADEPTGNLDPENAHEVYRHLLRYKEDGGTVIVVTHGTESEEYSDRIISMTNGRITSDHATKDSIHV